MWDDPIDGPELPVRLAMECEYFAAAELMRLLFRLMGLVGVVARPIESFWWRKGNVGGGGGSERCKAAAIDAFWLAAAAAKRYGAGNPG